MSVDYLKSVQLGIDYIEANLDFDIVIARVAAEAGISQWHFQRIFKGLTNETLKTYIRSRRLASSLDKLLTSDMRIIDIAFCAGFESQQSFSRAFKDSFKLTPNEYRKLADKSLFLNKLQFNREYLAHLKKNVSLTPQVYQRSEMLLVGCRTRFYSVDSQKNNIADKLPGLWAEFVGRIPEVAHSIGGTCYGVIQQVAEDSDLLEYHAAIAVSRLGAVPKGMHSIVIDKSRYAMFTHKGAATALDNTVNYVYSSWLLGSGETHSGGPDLEVYGRDYDPHSKESVIHYAIPLHASKL